MEATMPDVSQGNFEIQASREEQPLCTDGLAVCIGVAVLTDSWCALAHTEGWKDMENFFDSLPEWNKGDRGVAVIAGGSLDMDEDMDNEDIEKRFREIKAALKQLGFRPISKRSNSEFSCSLSVSLNDCKIWVEAGDGEEELSLDRRKRKK
jgi:hypothetical protein